MTEHPITPPPELVKQWHYNWKQLSREKLVDFPKYIATQAARWAADQELEACCEEMKTIPSPLGIPFGEMASNALRAADLLERLIPPQPIPVSERLPGLEDCDAEGRCWLGGEMFTPGDPTWVFGFPAWAERFPEVHRFWLPAHALPVPNYTSENI